MKKLFLIALMALVGSAVFAQVDVEHRRTLILQTGFSIAEGEEQISPFGFYWFNENHYPWDSTALRVIFAGVYVDSELSYFLPANTNTAVGVGLAGGVYSDSVTPYVRGERLSSQSFYGDSVTTRVFINHELLQVPVGDLGAIPLNLRGTYQVGGRFFRSGSDTRNFTLPDDFLTQTLLAELRFGGIEPGLAARRGLELYIAAEANYRSGFDAFGPDGGFFPEHSQYQRLLGSLAVKIPIARSTVFARVGGGLGDNIDELSAWRLGGNLSGAEPYTFSLHGYYTQEFLAEDFGIANIEFSHQIVEERNLTLHLYGDYAAARTVPPDDSEWHSYFGVGAGVGFRAFWDIDMLINYGYGINAVRNGDRGGHEIGLALQKEF